MIRPYRTRAHASSAGLTLIEMIGAVAVFSLIAYGLYLLNIKVFTLGGYLTTSLAEQGEIRRTLKTMVPALRSASQSSTGAYAIGLASSTALTFYSDVDGDGLKERYRYFLSTSTLWKATLHATGSPATYNPANEIVEPVIADIVYSTTTPLFQYYDRSFTGTSSPLAQPVDPLAVRMVRITIIVDKNPGRLPLPHTGTTQVVIRNLKDNL